MQLSMQLLSFHILTNFFFFLLTAAVYFLFWYLLQTKVATDAMVSAPSQTGLGPITAVYRWEQTERAITRSSHRSLNISRFEAPELKAKPRKASANIPALKAAAGRWDGQGLILISVRVSFIPVNYCHKITPIYWVWIKASLQRGSDWTSAFGTDGRGTIFFGLEIINRQIGKASCLQQRLCTLFILSHWSVSLKNWVIC